MREILAIVILFLVMWAFAWRYDHREEISDRGLKYFAEKLWCGETGCEKTKQEACPPAQAQD